MSHGARYIPNEATFGNLNDKVVVLTGGAAGIGASLVRFLHAAGAHVVFGDINAAAGTELLSTLSPRAKFLRTDVSKYADNVTLFKAAHEKHGRIDHAIACAGVSELAGGSWFDAALTRETVEQPDTEKVLEVNLMGSLYFARIALVYLREGRAKHEDRSLTLFSSAAGFREATGVPVYATSKHGVMGLMRALRNVVYPAYGIRVNALCPGTTDTPMMGPFIGMMRAIDAAINSSEDVAKVAIGLLAEKERTGQAMYVEGGRAWEIEENLEKTMGLWLGEEPTATLKEDHEKIVKAMSGAQ